jgi:hypothetical protein
MIRRSFTRDERIAVNTIEVRRGNISDRGEVGEIRSGEVLVRHAHLKEIVDIASLELAAVKEGRRHLHICSAGL